MKGNLYLITNTVNNKKYVGKTYLDIHGRFIAHLQESVKERSAHRPLYRAMNKYGIDNFQIELIGQFEEGLLEDKEIEMIQFYNTYKNGYNATLGGDGRRHLQFTDGEVITKYLEYKSIVKTAKYFNCSTDSISNILDKNNIKKFSQKNEDKAIQFQSKEVTMIDVDGSKRKFDTVQDAANGVVKEGLTKAKPNSARVGIARAISGQRKTYLKRKWTK